jgi:hypothetical protein
MLARKRTTYSGKELRILTSCAAHHLGGISVDFLGVSKVGRKCGISFVRHYALWQVEGRASAPPLFSVTSIVGLVSRGHLHYGANVRSSYSFESSELTVERSRDFDNLSYVSDIIVGQPRVH